jgi:transcriptional regulator with XRE-family HTH domain
MKDEDRLLARQLGQNVRRERFRKGYSQERLAELCSLHRSVITNIEKGQRLPHLVTLLKIISALEITAEELLRGAPAWVAGADGEWLFASQRG